jgi:hypothetical protein
VSRAETNMLAATTEQPTANEEPERALAPQTAVAKVKRGVALVNYQGIVIGPPLHGKSTCLREIAASSMQAVAEARLFAHDPTGDWERTWGMPSYKSAAAWKAALLASEGKLSRFAAFTCGSDELVALVTSIGERVNTAAWARFPMALVFDEGSMVEGSGQSYQGKADQRLSAMRRHLGVALAYNVQRVTMLTEAFYSQATDVFCFRLTSGNEVRKLEERCGLVEGSAAGLLTLPPFKYLHIQPGRGIVNHGVQAPALGAGGGS